MRHAILLVAAVGGLVALGAPPASAVGTRYPFCIQGPDQPGLSNCTFTSYEQCQATASGRRLYCIANPYYAGDGGAAPPPSSPFGGFLPPPPPPPYPPPPGYRRY